MNSKVLQYLKNSIENIHALYSKIFAVHSAAYHLLKHRNTESLNF